MDLLDPAEWCVQAYYTGVIRLRQVRNVHIGHKTGI
jgi:hypothetical protein